MSKDSEVTDADIFESVYAAQCAADCRQILDSDIIEETQMPDGSWS